MPPAIIAAAAGVGAGYVAASVGATVVTAAIVGTGTAILAHETGAADFVYDEIVEPIGDEVGRFVDNLLDDPIATIAKIAALATNNAWALPMIDASAAVARGEDLADVLKSAAISYVATEAGSIAGDFAGSAVADATGSELANTIISNVATGGTTAAAKAIVYGQDPWEAFLQGGTTSGVVSGVNAAMGKIDAATGGKPATETTAAVKGAFSKLPTPAQSIIKTTLTAALTGQDVTEELIASAVMRSQVVTEGLTQFFENNPNLGDAEVQALTVAVQRSATAALSGGDVGDAISRTLQEYGQDAFNEVADKTVKNTVDKVAGTYQDYAAKADQLNGAGKLRDEAQIEYNRIAGNIDDKKGIMDAADVEYQAAVNTFEANQTDANFTLLNDAIGVKNTATEAFNIAYGEYGELAGLKATYTTNNGLVDTYTTELGTIQETLVSDVDQLEDDMKPLYTAVDKAFVDSMTPDFNVEEYKEIHKLGDDVDGYQHYLTKGQYEGLTTNTKDFTSELRLESSDLTIKALAAADIDITGLTEKQLLGVHKYMSDTYGDDLNAIKTASPEDLSVELAKISQSATFETFGEDLKTTILDDVNTQLGTNYTTLNDVPARELEKTNITQYLAFETPVYDKSDGVTDEAIVTGNARLVMQDSGLLAWEDVGPNFGTWNSEYGQVVWEQEVLSKNGNYRKVIKDRAGNILYDTSATLATDVDGNQLYENGELLYDISRRVDTLDPKFIADKVDTTGPLFLEINLPRTLDIDHLRETNPPAFFKALGNAKDAAVDFTKDAISDQVKGYAELYDNLAEFTGLSTVDEIMATDTFKDTASVIVGGTGELLKSFNDLLILANINPASTPLGELSRDMIDLGGDLQSDSYKAAMKKINTRFAQDRTELGDDATQFETDTWYGKTGNQLLNVWDAFQEAPGYFVTEFIAKELVQEVPVLAATFLTGGALKVGMTAARVMAKQMTQEVIDKAAKRAGMTASSILDLAESAGGSAGGAFDEIYKEAINAGLSEEEAERRAQEGAVMAGVTGFITTGVSMGFLGGNEFENMVTNKLVKKQVKDAGGSLVKKIADGVKITVKESVQEAFEEGAVAGVTATHILEFNPDYDVASNITLNATLGAIGGAGTVTGTQTLIGAGQAAKAIISFNPTVKKAVKDAAKTAAGAASIVSLLNTAGIEDVKVVNEIANTVYSEGYTTEAEATNAFKVSNPGYVPDAEELNTFTGAKPDANLAADVAAYVDPRFIDADEVKAAALTEGVTLTDEQVAALTGQKDEADAVAKIKTDVDPQATTREEAEQFFADQNYKPSEEEILARVGQVAETDQKTAIDAYVKPRITSEDEVRQAFADQGYEPSDEEVAALVGQGDDTFADTTLGGVESYADERITTAAEVRAEFEKAGLVDVSQEDIDKFVGQLNENDQLAAVKEYVPTATTNIVKALIGSPSIADDPNTETDESKDATGVYKSIEEGKTGTEALEAALGTLDGDVDAIAKDLIDLTGDVGAVGGDVDALQAAIGEEGVTDDPDTEEDETKDPTGIFATIKAYEDSGVKRDNALELAIGDVSAALGTTKTELIAEIDKTQGDLSKEIGAVKTDLGEEIGAVRTDLGEDIGAVRTDLGADIDVVADLVGKPAVEVTQADIDLVAELIAMENVGQDETLQYDVTGDGIVDIADQTLLEETLQGGDTALADTSKFDPATGLYLKQDTDTQTTLDAITDMNTEISTQIATNQEKQIEREQFNRMRDAGAFEGASLSARAPDVAEIDYLYNISGDSIFATPEQEDLFMSPYERKRTRRSGFAQGGQVEDENDRLLRLLGDM